MPPAVLSFLAAAVWCSFCGAGTWAQNEVPPEVAPGVAPEVLTTSFPLAETSTPPLTTDSPVTSPPMDSVALETWLEDHVAENETVVDLVCGGEEVEEARGGSSVSSAVLQTGTLAPYPSVVHLSVTGCEDVVLEENSVPPQVETVKLTSLSRLGFREGWHGVAAHLRTLNVTLNKLKSLKLCDIPSLVTVDASENHLVELDLASCGKRLETLESLRAVHNELETLLLCSSPNLETLDVSGNRLRDITEAYAGCLHDASKLKVLLMAGNNISAFSSCSFPALETLEVSSNGLAHLDLATCPAHDLHTLLLAENSLSEVVVPKSVRDLDLSHNLLEELPHLPRNLVKADFSHNKLKKLGKGKLRRNRKLIHLNLAFNQLTFIKDGELVGLSHVQELDISHNQLLQLGSFALAPLNQLRNLKMQHNQLTYVHARTFDFLPEEARLHLADNPWMCSCQLLAHLQTTLRRHCGSKCRGEVTLYCEERRVRHAAADILTKCLQTVAQIKRDRALHEINATEATAPRNHVRHGGHGDDPRAHDRHQLPSVLTPHLHPSFDPDMDPDYDPESDEDQSEEMKDLDAASASSSSENEGTHFVLAVPAVVVLVVCVVVGVLVHRVYKKRRHLGTWCHSFPFCGGGGAGSFVQGAQKVPNSNGDSDSETEL